MSKEQALDLLQLLSAVESWSMADKHRMPDYLYDQIDIAHHDTRTMRADPLRYMPPTFTPPAAAAVSFAKFGKPERSILLAGRDMTVFQSN